MKLKHYPVMLLLCAFAACETQGSETNETRSDTTVTRPADTGKAIAAMDEIQEDDVSEFLSIDAENYNLQITAGKKKKEDWVNTPVSIVTKLFAPAYDQEGKQRYILDLYENDLDGITVVLTQEGLLDDAIFGERRVIEFVEQLDRWKIESIKLGVKCREGRGDHLSYTGGPCI